MQACQFSTNKNYFSLNKKLYRQIQGTAMGTRMAPSYANIFMKYVETQLIDTSPKKPKIWLRFIDDIFMIRGHDRHSLEDFKHLANNIHPTIKLSFNTNEQEIPFLEQLYTDKMTTIYCQDYTTNPLITNNTHISTLLIHGNRKSVPFGLLIRCKRICSEEIHFNRES